MLNARAMTYQTAGPMSAQPASAVCSRRCDVEDLECAICGHVITEAEADAGDYVDTNTGEVHDHCLQEWERDASGRAADYYSDRNR